MNGIAKISPFKLNEFSNLLSSKNSSALSNFVIVIIWSKLSLKKILLLLILIFFLENILLLASLNIWKSFLKNEKLALLIETFLSSIFSLSKKFFYF